MSDEQTTEAERQGMGLEKSAEAIVDEMSKGRIF